MCAAQKSRLRRARCSGQWNLTHDTLVPWGL